MNFETLFQGGSLLWSPVTFSMLISLAMALVWLSFRPSRTVEVVRHRLDDYLEGQDVNEVDEISRPFGSRVLRPLFGRLLSFFSRIAPKRNVEETEKLLTYAGRPLGMGALDFFGLQLMLALTLSIGYMILANPPSLFVQLRTMFFLFLVGYIAPFYLVRRRARKRRYEALRALPDALDMMTIGVEAGLAFESAMLRVSEKWDNSLTREFRRAVAEMRVGAPRDEALERVADRLGVPEIDTFVTVLIQSNQLGMSIAQVLHQQADEMRVRRRQRAEELARQAGGKMVFPLVLLFVPSLFIVIIGPLLPEMIATMNSLLASFAGN